MKSQVVLFAGRPKKFETGTVPLTVYELNDKPKQPPKPKKKEISVEDLLEYVPEENIEKSDKTPKSKRSNKSEKKGTVQLPLSYKIISPFDQLNPGKAQLRKSNKRLPLTEKNVELVLDEVRPFLKADGGNVRLEKIDGKTVILELEGACGSCSSSAMTMKMGLEKRLKERIPTIEEVIQSSPQGPAVTKKEVETVLNGIKKFISFLGGDITVLSIEGLEGLLPRIRLRLDGNLQEFQSLRLEIYERLMKHFKQKLDVEYVEGEKE